MLPRNVQARSRDASTVNENDLAQDPELVREFLVESEELLERVDEDMVALEVAPNDAELLNRIFRALHTIKGTSGFLGFDPVIRVSHRAEDVLNALRRGELKLSRRIIDVLLRARDQLGRMLKDIRNNQLGEYPLEPLLAELEAVQKPDVAPQLGDLLVAEGVIESGALKEVLEEQTQASEPKKLGTMLVEKEMASPSQVGEALVKQKQITDSIALPQTMRVDVHKLDDLINLIGELVLERNRLVQVSRDLTAGRLDAEKLEDALTQTTARVTFLTEELHVAGLKTRMVPIDTVFRKFPRIVRDLAHSLHKEVDLVVSGQDTELDKTMVELIGDPLVHLVRNSLDHGLEKPDDRSAAGKNPKGTLRLEAREEGDQIVISIADDGAGIDPERIARKAVEKGLVTADRVRTLSKREVLDFIFLPGFSTKEVASDVSGRGVGMDVVNTNVKNMNGTVELDSMLGQGTTVTLRLPLTMAILPVLSVRVGQEIYGLPMRTVIETLRVESAEIHTVEGCEAIHVRGKTIPLIRLADALCVEGSREDGKVCRKLVIVGLGTRRVAFLVDDLVGAEATVIKPLDALSRQSVGIAGATVGGDGMVRLLLDPASLVAEAENKRNGAAKGAYA
jgi:two-component system, chemotaxis family, sensor kinase CheA